MNIDGVNTLACTKSIDDIKGDIKISPLPHQPVIKDLVPDLTNFYEQHKSVQPWLKTKSDQPEKEWYQSKEDRKKSTVCTNALCVLVVLHHARVIGGTLISISVQLHFYKPIGGSKIVEMNIKKKD